MTLLSSRLPGFHKLTLDERWRSLAVAAGLDAAELALLADERPLPLATAIGLAENTVGLLALPLGIGLNFVVNSKAVLVPMVTEEPSVIAAASNAARLALAGGGFMADADPSVMIAQIQLCDVADPEAAQLRLLAAEAAIRASVDRAAPGMARRGGGARGVEVRVVDAPLGRRFVVVHLLVDVGDAMGANALNSIAEACAPEIAEIAGGRAALRILSNLADRRLVRASVEIPFATLGTASLSGEAVAFAVEEASLFAEADPWRATTHNKGIMNGIDAVALATGNDWRALEAGAHAFAARSGAYGALSTWRSGALGLVGRIELPIAVGTVGATVEGNPRTQLALRLLGNPGARELGGILAAVGLAQNLGALRALATEGIQRGHMARHARAVALAAGATAGQVDAIAEALIQLGDIKVERARVLLREAGA